MASVFRKKDRATGKGRPEWHYKFKDERGRWKYGIGWPDKRKTQEHALAVEAECRAIRKGEKEAPSSWLERRNTSVQRVIDEYLAWGRTQGGRYGRAWDSQNAALKKADLAWWKTELGLAVIAEVDLSRVERLVQQLLAAGKKPKTVALRVQSLRSLCGWAIRRGYLRNSPLAGMARLDTRPIVPHRALKGTEVAALLNTAPAPRKTWYEAALGTGFRLNELRSLRVKDLDPFGPSIFLAADFSKDRKDHRQPISRELLERLQELAKGKNSEEPLLGIPGPGAHKKNRYDPAGLLAGDCRTAGIPLLTVEGKTTWHSLRKAFVSNVVRSGCDLKTAMTLARHSTAQLTMETYAASDPALLREAVLSAEAQVKDAVRAASCCSGVARQVVGGSAGDVTTLGEGKLRVCKVVGDTGIEPVTSSL